MRDIDNFPTAATIEPLVDAVIKLADEVYESLATIGTALTTLWEEFTEKLQSAPR